jgi:DNA primase
MLIADLKARIPIESVIGSVIDLKHGKGLCPFHDDRHPSLSIKNEKFKCFACGEGGDVIDFVKLYYNLGTGDAIKYLASQAGVKLDKPNLQEAAEYTERRELIDGLDLWIEEYRNLVADILREYRKMKAKGYTTEGELIRAAETSADYDWLEYIYEGALCLNDKAAHLTLFKMEHGI